MCRTTDLPGVQLVDQRRRRLCIKSFHVRFFSGLKKSKKLLPESLTLRYVPRYDGSQLLIDGSKVKSDSDAFLTLYRIVQAAEEEEEEKEVVMFGSRERVRATEGVRFEIYSREDKILEGCFGRDGEEAWKVLIGGSGGGSDDVAVAVVEVCVAVEGAPTLTERVVIGGRRRRRRAEKRRRLDRLEVIPEVDDESDDGCWFECKDDQEEEDDDGDGLLDGGELVESYVPDLEGVSWAIDVGIWVVCLGVGLMVSKASARSMRRLRIL